MCGAVHIVVHTLREKQGKRRLNDQRRSGSGQQYELRYLASADALVVASIVDATVSHGGLTELATPSLAVGVERLQARASTLGAGATARARNPVLR